MQQIALRRHYPELKQLVAEASRALALLDSKRLEELALSCQALNRDLTSDDLTRLRHETKDAGAEMAVFDRVLDATRENIQVMNRLRDLRSGRLEYRERRAQAGPLAEGEHGDN